MTPETRNKGVRNVRYLTGRQYGEQVKLNNSIVDYEGALYGDDNEENVYNNVDQKSGEETENNEEEVIEAEKETSDDESYSGESENLATTQSNGVDETPATLGRKRTAVVNLLRTKNDDDIIRILN